MNNTMVVVDDIGEGENALFCVTDNSACCRSTGQGEFMFPNGSLVPTANAQRDFYRNRGSQFIRFNRRNGATSPLGKYSCDIPNASGDLQRIFLEVGKPFSDPFKMSPSNKPSTIMVTRDLYTCSKCSFFLKTSTTPY